MTFRLTAASEYGAYASGLSTQTLALATLEAPRFEVTGRKTRAPIDLVAVVDRSGSMKGEKLALVIETIKFVTKQLKPTDRFALVTYDTNVTVDLPLRELTTEARAILDRKVTELKAGSSTNLSGGLMAGIEQLVRRTTKAEVASVLLFTDGLANYGVTTVTALVPAMNAMLEKVRSPCTVFTFGFGADHSEKMLRSLADAARGFYYYIETADSIPQAFADCIGGLLSVAAQNITLTIQGAPGVQVETLLCKCPSETDLQRSHVALGLGDLYSEETRNIVCRLTLPILQSPQDSYQVLQISASYFDVVKSEPATLSTVLTISRPVFSVPQKRNLYLDRQSNRIRAAEAMEEARALADTGQLEKARAILSAAITAIGSSASAQDELCMGMLRDLKESIADMQSLNDYRAVGAKKIAWKSQEHERERCVSNNSAYDTELKKQMKEQARAEAEARRSAKLMVPTMAQLRLSNEAGAPPAIVGGGLRQASLKKEDMEIEVKVKESQMPEPEKKVTLGRRLLIGNEYRAATDTDRVALMPFLSNPTGTNEHFWTVYVRGVEGAASEVLESVTFTLPSSYAPTSVTVSASPFEVSRVSSAQPSTVGVRLQFRSDARAPLDVSHTLSFSSGASAIVNV